MAGPRKSKPFSTIPLAPTAAPVAAPDAAQPPLYRNDGKVTAPPAERAPAAATAAPTCETVGAPAFDEIRQLAMAAMTNQIQAQIGLASELSRATTLADAIAAQTAFARRQYETAAAQWKDLSRAAQRWMSAWSGPAPAKRDK